MSLKYHPSLSKLNACLSSASSDTILPSTPIGSLINCVMALLPESITLLPSQLNSLLVDKPTLNTARNNHTVIIQIIRYPIAPPMY